MNELTPTPASFAAPIHALAHGAGDILMHYFRSLKGYDRKGVADLQTIADRESEEYLADEILRQFPDHAILGEEGGTRGNPQSDYLWIVDPLDGTTNFVHGMRLFAVSIALAHQGTPIAGAVYAPALDEYYAATRGGGATLNGDPIHVSTRDVLQDALIVTGFPANRKHLLDQLSGMVRETLAESRGLLRLGSAALDFSYVAAGNLDAFYEYGIHAWDMAAGVLLVEEAGGRVTGLLEGESFDLYRKRALASNGLIHEELQKVLARGGVDKIPI